MTAERHRGMLRRAVEIKIEFTRESKRGAHQRLKNDRGSSSCTPSGDFAGPCAKVTRQTHTEWSKSLPLSVRYAI